MKLCWHDRLQRLRRANSLCRKMLPRTRSRQKRNNSVMRVLSDDNKLCSSWNAPDCASAQTRSRAAIFAEGATGLRFAVTPRDAAWALDVLDLDGRVLRALGGDAFGPGPREVGWDGSDDAGGAVAPGPW